MADSFDINNLYEQAHEFIYFCLCCGFYFPSLDFRPSKQIFFSVSKIYARPSKQQVISAKMPESQTFEYCRHILFEFIGTAVICVYVYI